MSERESIANWLEELANRHEERGENDIQDRHYHRGTAILYRARANDIRAELDVA